MKSIALTPDSSNRPIPTLVNSDSINYRSLAASVAETETKPAGANWVIITPNCEVYAALSGTAAVPAADITNGSGPIYCPGGSSRLINISQVSTFSLVAVSAGLVELAYYG